MESATNLQALIDTGASVTGIGENILNKLGYPPVGVANLASPSGVTQTGVYVVRLVIPSKSDLSFPPNIPRIIIDNIKVVAVKSSNQQLGVLLGRDILSHMILVYNGSHALVTLGY
ncbi:MAG: hypothetical protein ACP5LN_11125 [Thermoproteota archaeon]